MSKGDKECKIFVGGLHIQTSSQGLSDYFSRWGEIVDAIVMVDGETKKSRGFGFVTYADVESIEKCLKSKPHEIDGKEVEAKRAVPKEDITPLARTRTKKVFLGGLSPQTTKEDIIAVFSTIVDVEKMEVAIMTDKETDKPRGFGFVTFEDFDTADKLCIKKYVSILDRDVEVKKAVPQDDIRKSDRGGRFQSRAPSAGGGASHYGYSAGRDMYTPRPAMYPVGRMPVYDYGSYPTDYMRQTREYPGMSATYSMPTYDRATAGTAYTYGSGQGSPYDMASSTYGAAYGSAMMGAYQQASSAYGPARGYAEYRERGERTDTKSSSNHPYRR